MDSDLKLECRLLLADVHDGLDAAVSRVLKERPLSRPAKPARVPMCQVSALSALAAVGILRNIAA